MQIDLEGLKLKTNLADRKHLKYLLVELSVVIRGGDIIMTDQREEQGSHIKIDLDNLENERIPLFRTYLMSSLRPNRQSRYSHFQIRLRILPHYVKERQVLRNQHYFGEYLFQGTLTLGVRDSDLGQGRLIRAAWSGLEDDLPASGKRHASKDAIRLPIRCRHFSTGNILLQVRDEN